MEKSSLKKEKNSNTSKTPYYQDGFLPDCRFHHGLVPMLSGVECYQVVRANRSLPKSADNTNSTYKHAPDLTYYHGKFYIQYLCNPKDEHAGAGYSCLCSSTDGIKWEDFKISFPTLKIPKCKLTDYKNIEHIFTGNEYAFMHQRMCFYRSSKDKLLLLGFYGYSQEKWRTNWDNYGIGRVVRELYPDGSMSEIYFIKPCYQAGWSDELLDKMFPMYREALDKDFTEACEELLNNPLYTNEWAEENGLHLYEDGKIYQALSAYHIDENKVIGLYKNSYVTYSEDNGKNFATPEFEPTLVMSGQKIWGQNCGKNGYRLVYVPSLESTHRWPLCIVESRDGISFKNMKLICGEVPPMRYSGFWKDFGLQYMRGIYEGLTTLDDHPDEDYMYITYSVNKEDIWFCKIPVSDTKDKNLWIYNPKWTSVWEKKYDTGYEISIKDCEPVDYAKSVVLFKESDIKKISFNINIEAAGKDFYIYIKNTKYQDALRLVFNANGKMYLRTTADICIGEYKENETYKVIVEADCKNYKYGLLIKNDNAVIYNNTHRFVSATNSIDKISFQGGKDRVFPTLEDDPEIYEDKDLEYCESPLKKEMRVKISKLKISEVL